MELDQAMMTLVEIGASYPSNTDEYRAVLIGASAIAQIESCFGLTPSDDPAQQKGYLVARAFRKTFKDALRDAERHAN